VIIPAEFLALDWQWGDPPSGEVHFTVRKTEVFERYEPRLLDPVEALGKFVLVHYDFLNELNLKVSPFAIINFRVEIEESGGRRHDVDFSGTSAVIQVDRDIPSSTTDLPPGFDISTVVLFDVPRNATDLALVFEDYGLRVPLVIDGL
jgi:hypothetical protein